jgi:hypothetical protein
VPARILNAFADLGKDLAYCGLIQQFIAKERWSCHDLDLRAEGKQPNAMQQFAPFRACPECSAAQIVEFGQ